MNTIQIGDIIPDFSLKDQHGNNFDLSDIRGKKKLVLFFYPRDFSHNCTKEACYFRDLSKVFDEVGALVIGISGQSVESHEKFARDFHINYPLLSDEGNKLRNLLGVPSTFFGLVPGRVTYITDIDGKVVHIFNSHTQPERHADEALRICLLLKKSDMTSNQKD